MAAHLLELADDAQRVIFTLLSDALRPAVMLELSACCRDFRTVSEAARTELRRRHGAARRLCTRQGTSCAALSESTQLLWYGAGLTAGSTHLATLGMLLSATTPLQLEVINLGINRMGPEGMQTLCEGMGRGCLPRVRELDLTSTALGSVGAATEE